MKVIFLLFSMLIVYVGVWTLAEFLFGQGVMAALITTIVGAIISIRLFGGKDE